MITNNIKQEHKCAYKNCLLNSTKLVSLFMFQLYPPFNAHTKEYKIQSSRMRKRRKIKRSKIIPKRTTTKREREMRIIFLFILAFSPFSSIFVLASYFFFIFIFYSFLLHPPFLESYGVLVNYVCMLSSR